MNTARNNLYILLLLVLLLSPLTACQTDDELMPLSEPPAVGEATSEIPEGYFEVRFSGTSSLAENRAPVSGSDGRVRHLRYLIYKESGEFVKEKVLLTHDAGIVQWPFVVVRDTLPKGAYKAVFLGNVDQSLFTSEGSGSGESSGTDVLLNYTSNYADARITLPPVEFSTGTEYYRDIVSFSDATPASSVLLQRIIGSVQLRRNFIDARQALNALVANVFNNIGYEKLLTQTVEGLLPGLLRSKLGFLGNLLGLLDSVVSALLNVLVKPITDALYLLLVEALVDKVGIFLTGNPDADESGALAFLATALNPWQNASAHTTVVAIQNFPKTINLDLGVTDYFAESQRFRYDFNTTDVGAQRYISIKGFNGSYDIRRINVAGQGLVGGLVVDGVVDDFLLPGAFVDINDPIDITNSKTNRKYEDDYSFLDLALRSYALNSDGDHTVKLSIRIGDVANIDNIIRGVPLLGPVLDRILDPVKNIVIGTSVSLPLLGVDNMKLSGSWGTITGMD